MKELEIVYNVLQTGGPVAISCLLFYMWREERKESKALRQRQYELENKILDNTVAQTQAMTKLESSISGLKDVLNQVLGRIE